MSPLLETHTLDEAEKMLGPRTQVTIHAQKITGCNLPLQATAVWFSKDVPENYKSSDLLPDLGMRLNDYIFSQTGDVKFRSNPLCGAPDLMMAGVVKEYFSLEVGFILLESGETVLFNLDQVWDDSRKKTKLFRMRFLTNIFQ